MQAMAPQNIAIFSKVKVNIQMKSQISDDVSAFWYKHRYFVEHSTFLDEKKKEKINKNNE